YTLQARNQTDPALFEVIEVPPGRLSDWMAANLEEGDVLGIDPWLATPAALAGYEAAAAKAGAYVRPLEDNPVDAIWQDRPGAPGAPLLAYPVRLAGESGSDKLARV